jgi:hypothetical protein
MGSGFNNFAPEFRFFPNYLLLFFDDIRNPANHVTLLLSPFSIALPASHRPHFDNRTASNPVSIAYIIFPEYFLALKNKSKR